MSLATSSPGAQTPNTPHSSRGGDSSGTSLTLPAESGRGGVTPRARQPEPRPTAWGDAAGRGTSRYLRAGSCPPPDHSAPSEQRQPTGQIGRVRRSPGRPGRPRPGASPAGRRRAGSRSAGRSRRRSAGAAGVPGTRDALHRRVRRDAQLQRPARGAGGDDVGAGLGHEPPAPAGPAPPARGPAASGTGRRRARPSRSPGWSASPRAERAARRRHRPAAWAGRPRPRSRRRSWRRGRRGSRPAPVRRAAATLPSRRSGRRPRRTRATYRSTVIGLSGVGRASIRAKGGSVIATVLGQLGHGPAGQHRRAPARRDRRLSGQPGRDASAWASTACPTCVGSTRRAIGRLSRTARAGSARRLRAARPAGR